MVAITESFTGWLDSLKNIKWKFGPALIFLIISIIIYSLSGDYVNERVGSVVAPDLILDNIGPYNLTPIFIWGFVTVAVVFFAYPFFFKPREFPYVVTMFSIFLAVRSGFITFTHLRAPYDAIKVTFPSMFQWLNFSNDLFFSGHTGLPFLGFLIYHKNKWLSYSMLIASIVLGITVLLMHVHYSIDVLSAFFITYGIYVLGNKLLKSDFNF